MISVQQLRDLENIFAKPFDTGVDIMWMVPAWLAYLQQKLGQSSMPSFPSLWEAGK